MLIGTLVWDTPFAEQEEMMIADGVLTESDISRDCLITIEYMLISGECNSSPLFCV